MSWGGRDPVDSTVKIHQSSSAPTLMSPSYPFCFEHLEHSSHSMQSARFSMSIPSGLLASFLKTFVGQDFTIFSQRSSGMSLIHSHSKVIFGTGAIATVATGDHFACSMPQPFQALSFISISCPFLSFRSSKGYSNSPSLFLYLTGTTL